jgi:adenylate cyclase
MEPMLPLASSEANDAAWRDILTGTDPGLKQVRRIFSRIPSNPRCKMCASPFGGVGGGVMRLFWHAPLARNPLLCRACSSVVKKHPGGAEIQISVLFADVRGSTGLAEEISPGAFRNRLQAFYRVAWDAVTRQDGIIDKYMGDGVMALFIPGIAGERHAARAVAAGRDLIDGMARLPDPRLPVGVGVHSGFAYVGIIGNTAEHDFSALGDVVNVAARLGSVARAGELLVSAESAAAADLAVEAALHDRLELKGRHEPLEVVRL